MLDDDLECPNCYYFNSDNSIFCSQCATPLLTKFRHQHPRLTGKNKTALLAVVLTAAVVTGLAGIYKFAGNSTSQKQVTTVTSVPASTPDVPVQYASDPAAIPSFVATVIGVTDGDTVTVIDANKKETIIRLAGIDAPESSQDFGNKAKKNLSDLVYGKTVTVSGNKVDKYGRLVATLMVDGIDANLQQIKSGFAWHYKKYENEQTEADRKTYAAAESVARAEKLKIWSMPDPMAPWDYRAGGNIAAELKDKIFGNATSLIYHWNGCPGFSKIAVKNRIVFDTWEEAEEAGYRAATNCSTPKPETQTSKLVLPELDELTVQTDEPKYYTPAPTPTPYQYVTPPVRRTESYSTEIPQYSTPPNGSIPMAICVDGTISYSTNNSGSCSSHGGVSSWFSNPTSGPTYGSPKSTYSPGTTSTGTGAPKTVYVRGYTKSNGTYVAPYMRSAPRKP